MWHGRARHDNIRRIYPVFDIRTDLRPTVAEIDLTALRSNADAVSARVGPEVGVLAVLKADAYGHGALACARALARKVWGFAVSLVEEGIELRRGGVTEPIVVLGSSFGSAHRDVVAYHLTPVVSDETDLELFARAAGELGKLALHLKIDTGMSRLGVRPERLGSFLAALARLPVLELTGVCTHLADADGEDIGPSEAQLARFEAARAEIARAGFRPTLTHVANSAATARLIAARYDLCRPGLALYGYNSSNDAPFAGLRPALTLRSKVVALREVPAGTPISYGGLYRTPAPTRIATVPVGYADGYTRRLSGRAEVLIGGRRLCVRGAITMDMCMVDVGPLPSCRIGDDVVLLGAQGEARISAVELASWAGTIPWEIVCGISKRVPRRYLGEVH